MLVFFSVGIFTVLGSTTQAINDEYYSITTQGNLHDFTVNEMYDTGTANFVSAKKQNDGSYVEQYYSDSTDPAIQAPYFTQEYDATNNEYVRTYTLMYDLPENASSYTLFDQFYSNNKDNPLYESYFYPTFSIVSSTEIPIDQDSIDVAA